MRKYKPAIIFGISVGLTLAFAAIAGFYLSLLTGCSPKLEGHKMHLAYYFRTYSDFGCSHRNIHLRVNCLGFKAPMFRQLQGRKVNGIRFAWIAETDRGIRFAVYANGNHSGEIDDIFFHRSIPFKESDVYLWGSNKKDD